jgi:hypothetical protein
MLPHLCTNACETLCRNDDLGETESGMIVEIEAKLCPTVVAQKDEYRHELGTESKRDRDEIPMIPSRTREDSLLAKIGKNIGMAVAPVRSTVPLCHHSGRPPHARAPHAGRMTSSRQVSWLAGHGPSPPSQALLHKAQWQT